MKVVLLEDVYNHGVAGDVVDVAAGFARNYLIPQGMAAKATPGTLRQFENLRENAEQRREDRRDRMKVLAEQIEGLTLYFGVKAGENDKLYGSVTTAQIAEGLHEEIELDIDSRRVGNRPLRELGTFDVPVRLATGLSPAVKVVVHREDVDPQKAEERFEAEELQAEVMAAYEEAKVEYAAAVESARVDLPLEAEAELAEETGEEEAAEEPVAEEAPAE
jgi:large subunit ribosomal protein L9